MKEVRRSDYKPVDWTTKSVDLSFKIFSGTTTVESELTLVKNYEAGAGEAARSLVLNRGEDVELITLELDGAVVAPEAYVLEEKFLTITPPESAVAAGSFKLRVVTKIVPEKNTSLDGLYKSGSAYSTQCEAEGFRNITFYQDRPDVMATYTVRVEADKAACPVLLSNGNLVSQGDAEDGRHFAVWQDPFPKPCYLFALVAGDLTPTEDSFTTMSGKKVALKIYTSAKDADKTGWAMESLKRSMKWDEERFGLEYDLDLFNIVAVSDFNMGAMENKGLNIFNSRLVLASPNTASDLDYGRIEGVVGHEYFHNWTGNRVTCRDWFQLTLKEGLTVYRDQEFSADLNSRPVKRIEDVARLRIAQFAEDSSPMSHPIRPDAYVKMDNFYTSTVYEKGAEVIRMYATMLGRAGFRKGMDLYFKRHDGQAVTCDDFWQAMADANADHPARGDMDSLKLWYGQAGTPTLSVKPVYNVADKTLTLHCSQSTSPTPGQPSKVPVLIPIAVGILGPDGKDLPLALQGGDIPAGATTTVLRLTAAEASFTFTGVPEGSVPSVLRDFSAPVRCTVEGQGEAELSFLLANDSDPFNRFEAGQKLGRGVLLSMYATAAAAVTAAAEAAPGGLPSVDVEAVVTAALTAAGGVKPSLATALAAVLFDATLDGAFVARTIGLPAESELQDALTGTPGGVDPVTLSATRAYAIRSLAQAMQPQLEAAIARAEAALAGKAYSPDPESVALRTLRNRCLFYLTSIPGAAAAPLAASRFASATSMTDYVASLACLVEMSPETPERAEALDAFYKRFADEPLVLLKWLQLQAGASCAGNTATVTALMSHPAFTLTNPNACYSLFLPFASGSSSSFHAADGSGYTFLADAVRKVDAVNPQVASRIVSAFLRYKIFDPLRAGLMKGKLEELAAGELSDNVREIVMKSLAA